MTEHPMHRVTAFSIVGPHELEIVFDDGLVRRINFLPVLEGETQYPDTSTLVSITGWYGG